MAGVEAFFPRLFYLGSSTSTASAVSMMSATCEREVRDGTPEPARAAAFFSFESDNAALSPAAPRGPTREHIPRCAASALRNTAGTDTDNQLASTVADRQGMPRPVPNGQLLRANRAAQDDNDHAAQRAADRDDLFC